MKLEETMSLSAKKITSVESYRGYMQVLEYILQDFSYLHVVQYHFNDITDGDTLLPVINNKTFYQAKDEALKFAFETGKFLLDQY